MEITEVRIFMRDNAANPEEKLKAFATVTFDDAFVVRGLRVVSGDKGLFVAMPSRKLADGTRRDIAHPINAQTREYLEKKVLEGYETTVKEGPSTPAKEETSSPAKEGPSTPAKEETSSPAKEEPATPVKEETSSPAKEEPVTPAEEGGDEKPDSGEVPGSEPAA